MITMTDGYPRLCILTKKDVMKKRKIEEIRYVEMQTDPTKIHKETLQYKLVILELYLCQFVAVDLLQVPRIFL